MKIRFLKETFFHVRDAGISKLHDCQDEEEPFFNLFESLNGRFSNSTVVASTDWVKSSSADGSPKTYR